MVFSSNVFLFLFLPVFLGLYYLSGERYRNLLLLIASYVFYAWWRVDFLLLFAGVTVFNYWIGLRIGAAGVRTASGWRGGRARGCMPASQAAAVHGPASGR